MKAFIERHSVLIQWLSGLGIPVAVIFAGWLISNRIEGAKLDSEYVRLALGVLGKEAKPEEGVTTGLSDEELALRQWAVRLLNRKSPEKFTESEQRAILRIRKPFGGISSYYDYDTATVESYYGYDTDTISSYYGRKLPPKAKKPEPNPSPTSK
jgi:hypothetical protein